jgi:hypothetical protein
MQCVRSCRHDPSNEDYILHTQVMRMPIAGTYHSRFQIQKGKIETSSINALRISQIFLPLCAFDYGLCESASGREVPGAGWRGIQQQPKVGENRRQLKESCNWRSIGCAGL